MYTRSPVPFPEEFPAKYDPSGYFQNPGGTIPFPMPTNVPVGAWTGQPDVLTFGPGSIVGGSRVAAWGSPVFDFRPEFRASDGRAPANAQPVLGRSTGAGTYLWVQTTGLDSTLDATANLMVEIIELSHIYDSTALRTCTPVSDITSYFVGQQASAIVPIQPPGQGYPVRFWRAQITFTFLVPPAVDPVFTVFAAVY